MQIHKDIRIQFMISGRHYEAVGFLRDGESPVDGDEMLKRTDSDGNVVGEEDYTFILEHRKELPEALRKYYLVTKKCDPDDPRYVSCFDWSRRRWYEYWYRRGRQWNRRGLVLRCCM